MKIYVGNLSYDVDEEELRAEFTAFGKVESVSIISDRYTGHSKGFAFVEMSEEAEGQAAINGLNGKPLRGRPLNVTVARSREEKGNLNTGRGGFERKRERKY